ncbi:MAG: HAD family hydrolase [Candidatus Hodarchaeales archaeon]
MVRVTKVKCIFFDLDGVIFDSENLWEKSVDATIEHFYNVTPSSDFGKTVTARSNPEILKSYIIEYYPNYYSLEEEVEKTTSYLEEYFSNNMVSKIQLFPEVLSVLSKLKANQYLLGAATNAPKRIALLILKETHNILKYFDNVITIDDVNNGKPNPEMLLQSLKNLDLAPKEAIYIGDSLNTDGEASRLANIPFILLDRKKLAKKTGVKVISSLEGLIDLINIKI